MSSKTRIHGFDSLRAILMLLGIVLHVTLSYTPHGFWPFKDPRVQSDSLGAILDWIHLFRMPLFFLLSGYFSAMLWSTKGIRKMIKHRLLRIVLPFLLFVIILMPISSFSDNVDGIYTLMARNFFGACGEFFLQDAEITKLESNTVLNDLQFTPDSNFANNRPLYMARIKLRRSHNGARSYHKEYDSFNKQGALSYYAVNGAKRTILEMVNTLGRFFISY